jgi:hypothetical protein
MTSLSSEEKGSQAHRFDGRQATTNADPMVVT